MKQRRLVVSELLDNLGLQKLLKVSSRTLDRMIDDGRLPTPIELGPRTRRWKSCEIQKWIEDGCPAQADSPTVTS